MGTSTYSFGEDSPIKFVISDKLADLYNQAAEEFFKAQVRFNQRFGRQWDPVREPIALHWTRKQRKAWNEFGKIFNAVVKEKGPFHVNDIMDDFLVKNGVPVASAALSQSDKSGRLISLAAMCGVLYVVLGGLKKV